MLGDIEIAVNRAVEFANNIYREIEKGIRSRGRVALLTTGWLKSPGCLAIHSISSFLSNIEAHHIDLGFFTRYIAPYRSSMDAEGERTWLIIYGNPANPWSSMTDRFAKSLSMLGYSGIMLRSSINKEHESLEGIKIIDIPNNIDPILVYLISTAKAILEIARKENPSPRVTRLSEEISNLAPAIPDIFQRYEARLRDLVDKISAQNLALITTCTSRAFAEGLILDGCSSIDVFEITDLHNVDAIKKAAAIVYLEAEKDLMLQTMVLKGAIDLMLRTDPISSPIYYRILSMIISKMLKKK
ncbi:MAG: hypothetical protein QXE01_10060 [Sulfolobales archaeon]